MNPYVYSRSRRVLRGSKAEEQSPSAVSSLLSVVKSSFTSAISPAVAFAFVLFAAGSVGGMSLVAYSEISGGSEPALAHAFAYSGHGLVLGDSTTVARVGQLVYNPNSNPYGNAIFLVGPSGLYGFTGTDVFGSWGYALSQVVPENAGEVILPVVGTVPLKVSSCDTAIKQILVNCGNSSSLITLPAAGGAVTPRSGQLINKNGTVYLVGQAGLYGFPDLPTFQSWSFTFSQIIPGNSVELALSQIGIVPTKRASCTNPLDQITGVCGGSINIVTPTPASSTGIRAGQIINKNETVYLVGSNGLYGFTDLATFLSWGFTGTQIVPATLAEQALTQIGLVPKKISGCTAPLDQIAKTCGVVVVTTPPTVSYDVNSDGAVNVADFQKMVNAVLGTDTTCAIKCDLNGDGQVNVADMQKMTNYFISNGVNTQVTYISPYDVNSDGQVNVADFQKLYNAVLGIDTTCGLKCDVNSDGAVNVADLQKLINYLIGVGTAPSNTPVISSFTASPTSITAGQSTTLSWQVSSGAVVNIDNGVGAVVGTTSKVVTPTQTTTYTLTSYIAGADGPSASVTKTVTVTVIVPSVSNTPVISSATIINGTLVASGSFPAAGTYYVYVNGQGFAATLQGVSQVTAQVGTVSGSTASVTVLNTSYGISNTYTAALLGGSSGGSGGGLSTASLTANNQSGTVTVNVNDSINYQWSAPNASSATSYYTVNKPDTCGNSTAGVQYPWVASVQTGSISKVVQACQSGSTYTIIFAAPGYTSATLAVVVNPSSGSAQKITGVQGLDVTTNVVATSIITPGKYMVLYGNFIGTGDVVTINGIQQVVTSDSANQINVSLPASLSSIAGTAASVVVTNGNSSTNAYLVTVSH